MILGQLLILMLSMLIISWCGCKRVPTVSEESNGAVDTLIVVDTLGMLLGDSVYMFSAITDMERLPGGGVAVLDRMKGCISLFNGSGGFLRSFGRLGEGPGEFQFPMEIVRLPSGLWVVLEMLWGTVQVFDDEGEFIARWQIDGKAVLPLKAVAFDDSSFVLYKSAMIDGENGLLISFSLSRYNALNGELLTDYINSTFDPKPSTDYAPGYLNIAADGKGTLYVSRVDADCWEVLVFGEGDSPIDTVRCFPERRRVPVESGVTMVPGVSVVAFTYIEGSTAVQQVTNLPEHHPLISEMEVGSSGELLTRRGGVPALVWDRVSVDGELLGTWFVQPSNSTDQVILLAASEGCIYAFDPLSEDYHRIYRMMAPD